MAPTSPHPRFTFRADTGGGAPLTVLWTSPASVGVWEKTGAAGYTRRLIRSRSGDAFEINMGAEEEDNDEEQTKGRE